MIRQRVRRAVRARAAIAASCAAFVVSCLAPATFDGEGFRCESTADCETGLRCLQGRCMRPLPPAPLAAANGSSSFALNDGGKLALHRWVARRTGLLHRLHVRINRPAAPPADCTRAEGTLRATTHPVRVDGTPDTAVTLATSQLAPCTEQRNGTAPLLLDLLVTQGQELATVIANVDPDPTAQYFHVQYLESSMGAFGANARNERDPAAPDVYYGLDPRELIGFSVNGGQTWLLPHGEARESGGAPYIPTHVQEYADGWKGGQPYYYGWSLAGDVAMVFPNVPESWEITHLGAFTEADGRGEVTLLVNGIARASTVLVGKGMLRSAIAPVLVPRGAQVEVRARAGGDGLSLVEMHADSEWTTLLGLGVEHRFYLASDPTLAATLYPLPMYPER